MVVGDFPIETDTIVIGAGPGGYVAAIRAAQTGQKVTVIERENVGGVCLNVGCIPSKALISVGHRFEKAKHSDDMGIVASEVKLDFKKAQEFKDSVVKKLTGGVSGLLKGNNIEVVKGEAYLHDANSLRVITENSAQTYNFKNVIIATGSRPVEIPTFKFSKRVLNSTGALNLEEVPSKLVVIGGGYIGTELGSAYANLGAEVTILEGGKDILAGFEKQMTTIVKKGLKKKGVTIETNALAQGVEETETGVTVKYEVNGEAKSVEADYVLVTVGRRPNTDEMGLEEVGIEFGERGLIKVDKQCRTNVPNIYAIGDIVAGPQLAHKASYEGKVAAEAIAGEKSVVDYLAIPAVCFTDPEMATVGLSEDQAKEEGFEVSTGKFPFAANGRALALNETEGFVKLVARKEDGLLLGGQIVGSGASDMIAEIGLAIEAGMTLEDVAMTIHAHPTLGEITMETAEVALGNPIHIIAKK
ncbi:dihydrolipoyl dehydrogenase [Rummeliibacillus sp. G93]|uniref:Dihydrolipoyl dehydrogenase n=1 Tax=Rummeliibacillus stabekisii TaxID=241244 RepID=A0A143H9T4_9BACL|nr:MULTISPECIES: dihydrolipoyl dehydrogenase [Rummeliibacillus]AMW98286.1 dihydrolipoyl dehydrogenase [Rummeliibacillus stabekisii]MBB5170024.1 dihydrolipoamide dehydrogenase [Rummeliibacillus stabekisii]UQW98246.1 dihydrolipoyl dehydrogenase [Rummeliibacillus sp. G93]GEL04282.1 dihydrolipoyl dehydrogenase [Rummeliibacillus stabekisii]